MFHGDLYAAERTMNVRLADERRHVDNRRMARQVQENRRSSQRLHCKVLVWVGHRLVAWGSRLQERHSVAAGVPVSQSARHVTG